VDHVVQQRGVEPAPHDDACVANLDMERIILLLRG
jgi:hypothetical protein